MRQNVTGEGKIIELFFSPHSPAKHVGGNVSRRGRNLFSRLPCRYVIPGLRNQDQPSSRSAQHPAPSVRACWTTSPWPNNNKSRPTESRPREIGADIIPIEFRFRCARHAYYDHLCTYSWQTETRWDDWRGLATPSRLPRASRTENWTLTGIVTSVRPRIPLTRGERLESAGNITTTYVGIDTAGHPSCRRLLARYSGAGASLAASGTYRLADRNDLSFPPPPAHLSDAEDDVEADVDNDNVDDGDDRELVSRARSRATWSSSLVRGILREPPRRRPSSLSEIFNSQHYD